MKFYIYGISIVILTTLFGFPSVSSKSAELDNMRMFTKLKSLIINVQPIIKNVIKDLPDDESYNKYRQDLQNILRKLNERSGNVCFEKYFEDLSHLVNLIKDYTGKDGPAEAKMVMKLFMEHGHKDYLKKQWFGLRKVDLPKLRENIRKLDKTNEKYKVLLEMC
ncbi:uncharacterized protein LOC142242541 [Haematobia irritans]|uniref:uncharacterized protein LOC142242541 n=1 Tax=Haematobia irritans TaxID=7368 RepID=UPI003F50A747